MDRLDWFGQPHYPSSSLYCLIINIWFICFWFLLSIHKDQSMPWTWSWASVFKNHWELEYNIHVDVPVALCLLFSIWKDLKRKLRYLKRSLGKGCWTWVMWMAFQAICSYFWHFLCNSIVYYYEDRKMRNKRQALMIYLVLPSPPKQMCFFPYQAQDQMPKCCSSQSTGLGDSYQDYCGWTIHSRTGMWLRMLSFHWPLKMLKPEDPGQLVSVTALGRQRPAVEPRVTKLQTCLCHSQLFHLLGWMFCHPCPLSIDLSDGGIGLVLNILYSSQVPCFAQSWNLNRTCMRTISISLGCMKV